MNRGYGQPDFYQAESDIGDNGQAAWELHESEVVSPEFEAGIEMTRKVFANPGIPPLEIQECMERLRRELLAPVGSDAFHTSE